MNNRPIGIFDSGVGGLTVLKEIKKLLPYEDIIYFGDTARVPYGNKSKSTIVRFSTENTRFLLKKQVKMIVVACNTSSALALGDLRTNFDMPIIGVVEAGARKAVEISSKKRIAVLGTKSTIKSKCYERELKKLDKNTEIYAKECPLFVPLVEEGILNGKIVDKVIDMYLSQIRKKQIDTVILGCTHYPLLKNKIRNYLKNTFVIDSAKEVAQHVRVILLSNGLLKKRKGQGGEKFYVTDDSQSFAKLAKLFLKRKTSKPKTVYV